jgi:NitT/TauT family transport system permease protein
LLVEPLMSALNAVPRIVLAPLMVIWFGIGISSKVALAVSLVAVLIFFAVYTAIAQVDRRLIERVRTLGGDRRLLLTEVYLPSVASYVLSSLKVAVGFALTGVIVGEFVAASEGLGYLLSFAQSSFNAALSLAIIGLIMAFVMILLSLTERLERRLLRWR